MEKVSILTIEKNTAYKEEGWLYLDKILYEKGIEISSALINKAGILLDLYNVVNLLVVDGQAIYATSKELIYEP